MSKCKYCGKDAGLFSSKHKECEESHEKGLQVMPNLMSDFLCKPSSTIMLEQQIQKLQTDNFVSNEEIAICAEKASEKFTNLIHRPFSQTIVQTINQFLSALNVPYSAINQNKVLDKLSQKIIKGYMVAYFTDGATIAQVRGNVRNVTSVLPLNANDEKEAYMYVLNKAAENFLKDGFLSDKEETLIKSYSSSFSLSLENLPDNYKDTDLAKLGQAIVLKNFAKGIFPSTFVQLPILLLKNESLLWTYNNVTFYQEKVEKEFVRNNGGFSFKVCKGVYYHTGQSKGHPIEHSYMEKVAVGDLYITNQNFIFFSSEKGVKIPFKKLIGITPYSDGIEVLKDGASKRIVFQGFDSWFVVNLLSMVNI